MSDNVVVFPGGTTPEEPVDLRPVLEALLFAAGEPVTVTELATAIGEVAPADVRRALHELAQDAVTRGVRVVKVANGWQMRTDQRFADEVMRLRGGRPQRMSNAALECLAVVAYRQPCTRSEIEALRGVGSGGVVKTLLDKGWLRVVGRRAEPGRPLEYGTTPLFLEMFSLEGLDALPTLSEREELAATQDPDSVVVDGETMIAAAMEEMEERHGADLAVVPPADEVGFEE